MSRSLHAHLTGLAVRGVKKAQGLILRNIVSDVASLQKRLNTMERRERLRERTLEKRLAIVESLLRPSDLLAIEQLGDLLRPVPNSHQFERIGSEGDGGYVVPADFPTPHGAISVGVGPECSADDALAERGVRVWQFDHTVQVSPSAMPGVKFFRTGLAGKSPESSGDTRPLRSLIEMTGVASDHRLWLLLDAEGVEWDVLLDSSAPLQRFDVIVLEFHRLSWIANSIVQPAVLEAVRRVRRTHSPVAWNPNNYAPMSIFGGRFVPDVLEVTFVNDGLLRGGQVHPSAPASALVRKNSVVGPDLPEPFSEAPGSPYGPVPEAFASLI